MQLIADIFPNLAIQDQGTAPSFVLSEMAKKRLFKAIANQTTLVQRKLRQNDPEGAYDVVKQLAESAPIEEERERPRSVFSYGNEVLEMYQRVQNGYVGVPSPWPSITEITMGFWDKTATYFVARPGVGKTQAAVLIANHAHLEGNKVLFISPEMSSSEVAERAIVLRSGVSGKRFIKGELSAFELQSFSDCADQLADTDTYMVMDSSCDLSPRGMGKAIEQHQPDIVLLDSIYMLDFKGSKAERTEKAVDWIRQASKHYGLPLICFHQLSRAATKDKKHGGTGYDTSAIALTDQLLWDAHAVFILEQDKDMKADDMLQVHVGKIRRGQWDGKPIRLNWNFESMDFSEIESAESFDDEEFDDAF
jgi:replicative DNA helicase